MRTERSSLRPRVCAMAITIVAAVNAGGAPASADNACEPIDGLIPGAAIVRGSHDGAPELTEYMADGSYRVTRCAADGSPRLEQHHANVPIPGGRALIPVSRTVIDEAGNVTAMAATFPDFSQPLAADDWARHGEELRARSLPATGPRSAAAETAPQPEAAVTATGNDPSCTQYGWSSLGTRWQTRKNIYYLNLSSFPGTSQLVPDASTPGSEASYAAKAVQGYEAWDTTDNPCFRKDKFNMVNVNGGYSTPRSDCCASDALSLVDFGPLDSWSICGTTALACTVIRGDLFNGAVDADIRFNERTPFWDGTGNWPGGTYDLRGVATHEAGHAIGLGHTSDPDLTMECCFAAYSGSGDSFYAAKERNLGAGDIIGQDTLYPPAG